jgi:hypothetical protein
MEAGQKHTVLIQFTLYDQFCDTFHPIYQKFLRSNPFNILSSTFYPFYIFCILTDGFQCEFEVKMPSRMWVCPGRIQVITESYPDR